MSSGWGGGSAEVRKDSKTFYYPEFLNVIKILKISTIFIFSYNFLSSLSASAEVKKTFTLFRILNVV